MHFKITFDADGIRCSSEISFMIDSGAFRGGGQFEVPPDLSEYLYVGGMGKKGTPKLVWVALTVLKPHCMKYVYN